MVWPSVDRTWSILPHFIIILGQVRLSNGQGDCPLGLEPVAGAKNRKQTREVKSTHLYSCIGISFQVLVLFSTIKQLNVYPKKKTVLSDFYLKLYIFQQPSCPATNPHILKVNCHPFKSVDTNLSFLLIDSSDLVYYSFFYKKIVRKAKQKTILKG